MNQQAGTLSGGEQEMVVVGRALMARPRLLLLDEPSLGLAPMVVREIARLVTQVNQEEKVSVILVEQNSRMALKVSQYAYVLETGTLVLKGRRPSSCTTTISASSISAAEPQPRKSEKSLMTTLASRRLLMGMGTSAVLAGVAAAGPAAAQSAAAAPLRILLLNPNSSPDFTKIIAAEARRVGSPTTEFVAVTAPFGPKYIGTRTTIAIAGHAAVDALAQALASGQNFDAAILAGFGAQGVPALQEMAPFPVVDMLTASVGAALLLGRKFSALTGGSQWVPMLQEQIEAFGLGSRLASVRSIPLTGAEIAKDQDKALVLLAELAETCVREDGADCVILGGAAVAGLHHRMADRVSVPLLDSVATSVAMAELLARVATRPGAARNPLPAVDSVGLSKELTAVLKPAP